MNYWYLFNCDYGNRVREKPFIKDLLRNFDRNYATLVGAVVNNNPYHLEFSIAVNIQGDPVHFADWMNKFYPEKLHRHNIFLRDLFSLNMQSFTDEEMIDLTLIEEGNGHMFFWPERKFLIKTKPQYASMNKITSKVFISHSSLDKTNIVNPLYSYLQAENIPVWLDNYEIQYGDNIYLKVNEGIENSELGLFVLTNNFFDSGSGWPITEFSAFFMELMKSNKKVLMINAGVDHNKLHALMKVYKYIDWNSGKGMPAIANAIKNAMKA